jgi:heterodisulfide reductase subunit A
MPNRIGFYICHCGINIAYRVRVEEVAAFTRQLPDVAVARDYKFMCSDPGQEMIENDIKEFDLNRVVVASCSPRLHEKTFQGACQRAGLNPYLFQMASVREQVSWVTTDEDDATRKAKTLAAAAINRVNYHHELETREVDVHPDILVVGGGIVGMHAALDIGASGQRVYLVEKDPTIGGHMLQFDKYPKDGIRGPKSEHRSTFIQRGAGSIRLYRQLYGENSVQAPLCERRRLYRLWRMYKGLSGDTAE